MKAYRSWKPSAERFRIETPAECVSDQLTEDREKLLDLLEIGLIDATWLASLLPEHAARLQQLIDDPDG